MASKTKLLKLLNQLSKQTKSAVSKAEKNNTVVSLSQSDFTDGTYIIDTPGVYRLTENISFNPNNLAQTKLSNPSATSWDSGDVLPTQFTTAGGKYDPAAYGIGFFAAIAIQTDHVVLDLNNFKIEQSAEHALQQRFFAVIELADQPFKPTQGPHGFGDSLLAATNCSIINGTIGRSSHHGIHGNDNRRIFLKNLKFTDYEVATFSLNQVKDLCVINCRGTRSRADVPVLGIFSAARFLRPYLNKLDDDSYAGTLNIAGGGAKGITDIKTALKDAVDNAYDDIMSTGNINKITHPDEWALFHNPHGIVDGNCYGCLVNHEGVAVLGFPDQQSTKSQNIYMRNVVINNHHGFINEIPALPSDGSVEVPIYGGGTIQNDSVGAVFQTQNRDPDGALITIDGSNNYVGNVVSNAQALVTKAKLDGFDFGSLSTSRNSITSDTLDWIETTKSLTDIAPGLIYKCNGDSMFHVNKGVIGFKIDAADNVYMENCRCYNILNKGAIGSELCDEPYKNGVGKSHPDATYYGYGGAITRGWSIATSTLVTLKSCLVDGCEAEHGSAYGYDIHLNSEDVKLTGCEVANIKAGTAANMSDYQSNPTEKPLACGIHVHENVERCNIKKPDLTGPITSPYKAIEYCINMHTFY